MKQRKWLSCILCVALMLGTIVGLGVLNTVAATAADCVEGATLTALNGAADVDKLPVKANLLSGLTTLSSSSNGGANWVSMLADGNFQGINKPVRFQKTDDQWLGNKWNAVPTDIESSRTVLYTKVSATETSLGYAQVGYDLGDSTLVKQFAVCGEFSPKNYQPTLDCFKDPDYDGTFSSISCYTLVHMGDLYVSDSADTLYDDTNKVVTFDYLNGNLGSHYSSLSPVGGIYTLDTAKPGRYVGFRFYVAGVDGDKLKTNGVTWGWYNQVRLSELGVYGDVSTADGTVYAPINSVNDLPERESLIAGKIATTLNGDTLYASDKGLSAITDGKCQGLDEKIDFVLSDTADTAVSAGKTYYSFIAPPELVEEQGLDTGKTWYLKPNNGRWQYSTTSDTRASVSAANARPVYDMGTAARVDQILIASSIEIANFTNNTIALPHPTVTFAQIQQARETVYPDRFLYKAKVYVGDTMDVFNEGTLVMEYDWTSTPSKALRNLFTLSETAVGRYVGFDFTECPMNNLVRISELAVYGSTETETTAFGATDYADSAITARDNILNSRVSSSPAVPAVVTDGYMTGMNKDYTEADCWAPVFGAGQYQWITFDMGQRYDFRSFLLAGSGEAAYGAESLDLYIGDETAARIQANGTEPIWSYGSNVTFGVRADFPAPYTGRYLVLKIGGKDNAGNIQAWISEIAATGTVTPTVKTKTEKIICVGDSITWGAHFPATYNESTGAWTTNWNTQQFENNYTVQLERLLDMASADTDYTVVNAGIGGSAVVGNTDIGTVGQGDTATSWFTLQASKGFVQAADKVLIMLGTNDSGFNWENLRKPIYTEYYKHIIDAYYAANPDVQIYIVTSPYAEKSPYGTNLREDVVPLQAQLAGELGLPLIDVYAATRDYVNENGIGAFLDANDIHLGVCVHPCEDGLGVIAQTCFDALTGITPTYSLETAGAQVRGYESGVPADNQALRFLTSVNASGVTCGAGFATTLTADSKITLGGKAYTVTGMGTLVARADKAEISDLTLGSAATAVVDIPAVRLYEQAAATAKYTAVIMNIPENRYDSEIVARPYVQYTNGTATFVAYGAAVTRTINGVVRAYTTETLVTSTDRWNGYDRMTLNLNGTEAYLIAPKTPAAGNHWLWRTEFFDNGAAATCTDLELLEAGWYLGYCRVSNQYGDPASVAKMKEFYNAATIIGDLDSQAVLMGASRGGLYAVNYAATHPADVAGLYLDAPVQDICSWPGALYGDSTGDAWCWSQCKSLYGLNSDAEALADRSASPVWKYDILTANRIPVLLVYGTVDTVVPFARNGQRLVDAYTAADMADLVFVHPVVGRGHAHGWVNEASAYILAHMS